MDPQARKTIFATAVIIAGFVAVVGLTRFVEASSPALPPGYEDADLGLQGSRLKGFVFGAEGLLADWYWMNSLQYMGKKISAVGLSNLNLDDMRPLNPRLLYPYLNNATDLDPKFMAPYSYGATILPAIDPAHAIALTEKGIANNPDKWRLHQYLGYIHWRQGDYEKASTVYGEGAQIEGSPVFMKMMEARMKTEGGSRDTAREMYRQIAAESNDDVSRESAELRLLQIDWLDQRDLINQTLNEFRTSNGRCPASWSELLPALSKKTGPGSNLRVDRSNNIVDPSGAPYILVQKDCTVSLGAETKVPRV